MDPFAAIDSEVDVVWEHDIDTDQIIPARFLTTTSREGLAAGLFHGWRHDAQGQPLAAPRAPHPRPGGPKVLLAGRNFGCGSSREHAPWALMDAGYRAIVAPSFADIFRQNALNNGLLPVALPEATCEALARACAADPRARVQIDLDGMALAGPGGLTAPFAIEPFARRRLLDGHDELDYLLAQGTHIAAFEADAARIG